MAVRDPNPFNQVMPLVTHAEVPIAVDAGGERTRIEVSLNEAADIAQRLDSLRLQALVRTERAHLARAVGDAAGWECEPRETLRSTRR